MKLTQLNICVRGLTKLCVVHRNSAVIGLVVVASFTFRIYEVMTELICSKAIQILRCMVHKLKHTPKKIHTKEKHIVNME